MARSWGSRPAMALVSLILITSLPCRGDAGARGPRRLTVGSSNTTVIAYASGLYWVLALPALAQSAPLGPPEAQRPLLEQHDSACTRVGLVPTARTLRLNTTTWGLRLLRSITVGLNGNNRTAESSMASLGGCCVAGAWCESDSAKVPGVRCVTHAVGGQVYDNFGWLPSPGPSRAHRPLYTCVRPLSPGEPGGQSLVPPDPPVVTAVHGTRPGPTFGSPQVFVPATNLTYKTSATALRTTVTVDGFRLGDEPRDIAVTVGGLQCANPAVCHRFCEPCAADSDCDSGKQCLSVGVAAGAARSVCVPECDGTERRCPCGGECYPVRSSTRNDLFYICLNRQLGTQGQNLCSASARAEARPPAGQGDNRIECDIPPGMCPASGRVDVVVSDVTVTSARSASTGLGAGFALGNATAVAVVPPGQASPGLVAFSPPSGGVRVITTAQQLEWPWGGGGRFLEDDAGKAAGERPSSPSWPWQQPGLPRTSRPVPVAAMLDGFCTSDLDCLAANKAVVAGSNGIVAGIDGFCYEPRCLLGCCVASPTGRCASDPADGSGRDIVGGLQYLPLPRRTAALLAMPSAELGSLPGDKLSPVSAVDDTPFEAVDLAFSFPFYGDSNVSTVYIGANGFTQVRPEPPCGGFFASGFCSIRSAYRGTIGALISDWNPGFDSQGKVWWRMSGDALCVRWERVPLWAFEPEPDQPRWTLEQCLFADGAVRFAFPQVPGTPNFTDWFSGVRALGEAPDEVRDGALAQGKGFPSGGAALGDVALADETSVAMASGAVRSGALVGMCSTGTVACVTPRCGQAATTVRITWAGVGCGIGLGQGRGGARLLCVFGSVAVNATLVRVPGATNSTPAQVVECLVPAAAAPGAAGDDGVTVPVSLTLVLPETRASAEAELQRDLLSLSTSGWNVKAAASGAGVVPGLPSAAGDGWDGYTFLDLAVVGVLAADNSSLPSSSPSPSPTASTTPSPSVSSSGNVTSNSSASAAAARRLLTASEPLFVAHGSHRARGGSGREAHSPRHLVAAEALGSGLIVASHTLMFTVLGPGSTRKCGCDVTPASACDSCGKLGRSSSRRPRVSRRPVVGPCVPQLTPGRSLHAAPRPAGVCNGGGRSVDCTGQCLGSASVDTCGVCSGGRTGKKPDAAKDCRGICFGPGTNCPSPSPAVGTASARPSCETRMPQLARTLGRHCFGWCTGVGRRATDPPSSFDAAPPSVNEPCHPALRHAWWLWLPGCCPFQWRGGAPVSSFKCDLARCPRRVDQPAPDAPQCRAWPLIERASPFTGLVRSSKHWRRWWGSHGGRQPE